MNHSEKIKKLIDDLEHSCNPEAEPPYVDRQVAHTAVHAAIDEMQAEIDRLTKDAERYASLKRDFSAASVDIDGNHCWVYRRNFSLLGSTLDEAVDKARQPKPQARGDET